MAGPHSSSWSRSSRILPQRREDLKIEVREYGAEGLAFEGEHLRMYAFPIASSTPAPTPPPPPAGGQASEAAEDMDTAVTLPIGSQVRLYRRALAYPQAYSNPDPNP